jgi:hypothetical protein
MTHIVGEEVLSSAAGKLIEEVGRVMLYVKDMLLMNFLYCS